MQSIYPGCVQDATQASGSVFSRQLAMDIAIALPKPIATRLITSQDPKQASPGDSRLAGPSTPTESMTVPPLELSYLPGLTVRLVLPADYPIQSPPKPIGIRAPLQGVGTDPLGASWLSRTHLRQVQDKLRQMWAEERDMAGGTEGTGVLWRWWDWIAQGEFLAELGLIGAHGELR